MINNKISELKNIFENSNTNSNDEQYLKIRRKTLFFFKANVAFTRSEIYGKVIQKIKTDNMQLQDISSLNLESLNIFNGQGLNRMNDYLSEIKNAILENNPQNLGNDYRDGMQDLINKLYKYVFKSPYSSFKFNLFSTKNYTRKIVNKKEFGFSKSGVTEHTITNNNQTITYVKKTNPSSEKDAINAALASQLLKRVVEGVPIKLADEKEAILKILDIQAYAGTNNIKQIQGLMKKGEMLTLKPQGVANISDYKQSVMLGTVFDFFKLADNIAYNIRPIKNDSKGTLDYVVFDMDDAFLPTQLDDPKKVSPNGIFFDITKTYSNMLRNNIFDFLNFAVKDNPANRSINQFLLERNNIKLKDFIDGMKDGLIKIQNSLSQDTFETLVESTFSHEKLGNLTKDLYDYKNKLQETFISRLQNLKHCIAALDKIEFYFSLDENIKSLMQESKFKENLINKLCELVENEISNSDLFKNKNLQQYYEMTTHTKTFSGKDGIKKHTQAVLNNFNKYYKANCKVNTSFDALFIEKLLKLHDIGKGINPNTTEQHENTIHIISENAENIGLSNQEVQIITTIIEHEPIGKLFKRYNEDSMSIKNLDYSAAADQLKKAFLTIKQYKPNLTEKQFFNLICMYYSCDATTYPFIVKKGIFDKQLQFKDNYRIIIDKLYNKFKLLCK